jgi:hypothetical protein
MTKINVAIHGAYGSTGLAWTAQMMMCDLKDHPFFDLAALVAEQPTDVGKNYSEVLNQWFDDRPLAHDYRELKLIEADGEVLKREADIGLVISSSRWRGTKERGRYRTGDFEFTIRRRKRGWPTIGFNWNARSK